MSSHLIGGVQAFAENLFFWRLIARISASQSCGMRRSTRLNKTVGTKTLPVDDKGGRFIEPALRSRLMLKI